MSKHADSTLSIFYALGANFAIFVAKLAAAFYTGSGAMLAEAVITSYSIHYTKLYEADFLTGPAGGTGPENILGQHVDQPCLYIGKGGLPQLIDHLHRRQGFAGSKSRATVLAASYNFV